MFSSSKLRKFISYTLVGSLFIAGLIQSVTRPSDASHEATPTQLAPTVKKSKERAAPEAGAVDEATKARVSEAYNKLPLRFEENRGQVDKQVKFISRGSDSTLFLTSTEAVLTLRRSEKKQITTKDEALSARGSAIPARPQPSSMSVVRMRLHGANRSPRISGEREMNVRTNYFTGNDPQRWQTEVAQYERVRYAQVYPGIDVIYYGQEQRLEYDFEVQPGANPQRIVLGFKGARKLRIEAATGDLLLQVAGGELRQQKPVTYQEINGERREIESRYELKGKRRVGIKVGEYDRTQLLVIDPVIRYSTYLGGNGWDNSYDIAVDSSGNAYVTGFTLSSDFPILNQYQTDSIGEDVFVTKLNPNLPGAASLLYSTYLSGSFSGEGGQGIALDASANVYVVGYTSANDFPTINSYQTYQAGPELFVAKFNTNLPGAASLLYSSYLGGFGGEVGDGIAVDSSENVYVTGRTNSTNFPTVNPYQTYQGRDDAFVAKLNPSLPGTASLLYSTYLGGSANEEGRGIALDGSGNAYVTGFTTSTNFPTLHQYQTYQGNTDVFVTKLNPSLPGAASLLYSTYLGGSAIDGSQGIALDASGNAYVTGSTSSTNFPLHNPYLAIPNNGYLTKLNTNAAGTVELRYSTYMEASGSDIEVHKTGYAYVTGLTICQQLNKVYVAKFNTNLSGPPSLLDHTCLGGIGGHVAFGIAVDRAGNAYVTGATTSPDFPMLNQYQTYQSGYDAYVTKVCFPHSFADYDTDEKTDFAYWRPSNGNWQVINSVNGSTTSLDLGMMGDKPVPGDYDDDGKTDFAVFHPPDGTWHIQRSSGNEMTIQLWGQDGDIPVARDYDGDGKTDLAVFRPLDNTWHILYSSNSNSDVIPFGMEGDKPVPADYDGDGKADLAVLRANNDSRDLYWYILNSFDQSNRVEQWGDKGDRAVPADYDGDCRADVAVWRPEDTVWYILKSSDSTPYAVQWGLGDDIPVPGDYDGDGKADFAVWRATPPATWYVLQSSDSMLNQREFGSSGDVPVPSAYLPESD